VLAHYGHVLENWEFMETSDIFNCCWFELTIEGFEPVAQVCARSVIRIVQIMKTITNEPCPVQAIG